MTLWTPSDATSATLVAWWRAATLASLTKAGGGTPANGDLVSDWASLVGSFAASQATGGAQPTYSTTALNGNPALVFTAAHSLPFTLSSTANGDITIATMAADTSGSSAYPMVISLGRSAGNGNSRYVFRDPSGVWAAGLSGAPAGTNVVSTHNADSTPRPVLWTFNTTSNNHQIRVDGNLDTTLNYSGTLAACGANGDIGLWQGFGSDWGGPIGEIVIYSGVLSSGEQQQLEGYLAWQAGTQANLPSGHPYKSAAPTTGGGAVNTPISCLASSSSIASQRRSSGKALLRSSSSLAALVRSSTRTAGANSSALASLVRSSGKLLRATSNTAATSTRSSGKLLRITSAAVASLNGTKVKLTSALATSASVASRVSSIAVVRRASSASIAAATRIAAHFVSALATSAAIASSTRSTAKKALTTSAAVAALVTGKAFVRVATATSAAVASASAIKLVLRSALATSSAVATLSRSSARLISAASNAVAIIKLSSTRTLLATSAATSILARSTAKLLRAISAPIVSFVRGGAYIPPAVPSGRNVAIVEKGSRSVSIVEVGSRHVDLG